MNKNTTIDRYAKRLNEALGARLFSLRTQRNLTLREISDASGVCIGTLSNIESGKGNITLSTLVRISAALEIEPDTLLSAAKTRMAR